MSSDILGDPQFRKWAHRVLREMAPKLKESSICISIAPSDGGLSDVKFWVELGAAIMYDKPIIVTVFHDQPIPEHLERVADEVVRLPRDFTDGAPGTSDLIAAIERVEIKLDAEDEP